MRAQREVIDWNTSIAGLREKVEKSSQMFGKLPKELEAVPADMENPEGEYIRHIESQDGPLILYFHGGGYVMGTCRAHRAIVAKVVRASGVNALCFEYRLAPEHPFPSALEDAVAAYQWLLESGRIPSQVVFMGDSAGAGLCLAALLALKEQGLPQPAGAVAMSPWTDLLCSSSSHGKRDPLAPEGSWEVFGKYYAGENAMTNPLISPLYGDLSGLPPLFLSVGDCENLLDDSVRFAQKAEKAGVDVTLQVGKGMVHCYPALTPMFPEAKTAMEQIALFIRRQLGL